MTAKTPWVDQTVADQKEIDEMELAKLRAFIQARRWQFAKTYADKAPHEYTVREWVSGEDAKTEFHNFLNAIGRYGYKKKFGNYKYSYLVIDGYKYWRMGAPTLINREPVAGYTKEYINENR